MERRGSGWRGRAIINGVGAVFTLAALAIELVSKFTEGAWLVVIVVPLLVLMFSGVHRVYRRIGAALQIGRVPAAPQRRHSLVVVPVGTMSRLVAEGISAALSLGDEVVAVTVCYDDAEDHAKDQRLREQWERWHPGVPLVTLHSKKRSLGPPIVDYLRDLEEAGDQDQLVVLIPEVQAAHPWQAVLHNQRGFVLEQAIQRGTQQCRHLPAALRPVGGRRARGWRQRPTWQRRPMAAAVARARPRPAPSCRGSTRRRASGRQRRAGSSGRLGERLEAAGHGWTTPSSCCWRSRRSPACAGRSGSPPAARPTHPATRSGCRAWPIRRLVHAGPAAGGRAGADNVADRGARQLAEDSDSAAWPRDRRRRALRPGRARQRAALQPHGLAGGPVRLLDSARRGRGRTDRPGQPA